MAYPQPLERAVVTLDRDGDRQRLEADQEDAGGDHARQEVLGEIDLRATAAIADSSPPKTTEKMPSMMIGKEAEYQRVLLPEEGLDLEGSAIAAEGQRRRSRSRAPTGDDRLAGSSGHVCAAPFVGPVAPMSRR